MLSQNSFIRKCEENKCCFFKNFNAEDNSILPLNDDSKSKGWEELKQSSRSKGVRFPLTLGPIVKRHNFKVPKKQRFQNRNYVQDLRQSGNTVKIDPQETISVLTNEYVETDGETCALIFPRLSLVDVGLALLPTYVDPYWSGILQMTLVNNTNKSINVNVGEAIGVIFFQAIDETVGLQVKDSFPNNSHHFGQNWQKILEQDGVPFPTKKNINESSIWQELSIYILEHKKMLQNIVGIFSFSTVLFGGAFAYHYFSDLAKKLDKKIEQNKEEIKKEATARKKLDSETLKAILKGSYSLQFKKGDKASREIIDVNIKSSLNPLVIVQEDSSIAHGDEYKVDISETKGNVITKLTLSIVLRNPVQQETLKKISWVIIP